MSDLRLFGTLDELQQAINEARRYVGNKAEALTVSAADAFLALWSGDTVELDGCEHRLLRIGDTK